MLLTPKMKLAEVVHQNYHLLPIISRFGIRLGFEEKTVTQVCGEYHIDENFFLEILNSFHDKSYFPKRHLQSFSVKLIIDYLKRSHDYYLRIKIPEIDLFIKDLVSHSLPASQESAKMVRKFFDDYKWELSEHLKHEEIKVYPYALDVENAYINQKPLTELINRIKEYSIDDFEKDHDNVEDKLYDLKNIIIKYLPPADNSYLSNTVLTELFRLESDLNDHARIEDKVLVPKVKFMEKWLTDNFKP